MKPKSAKKLMVTAPAAAENRRSRKSEMSSIGWSATVSRRTKTASRARLTPNPSIVWRLVHPDSGASMIVHVSVPSSATEATRPGRSSGGTAGSRDSGTKSTVITSATTATGTIAQKTLCQAKCSSSQPPATGPAATPTPVAAPQMPSAAAR